MRLIPQKVLVVLWIAFISASCGREQASPDFSNPYFGNCKPMVRWWWFATQIKKEDIAYQLDWFKEHNFGGVEIAWVYPLHRYKEMYANLYGRHYPVDTTAPKWLSQEWQSSVRFAKHYADSIGLNCHYTLGTAWPAAGHNIGKRHTSKIYGDTAFRQELTFSWDWPDTFLVIDHLDSNAFYRFAEPVADALREACEGKPTSIFTDSWEVMLNGSHKLWTDGFEVRFREKFGYDIIPYMDQGLDSFPDVRYDYMLLLDEYVTEGFYQPFSTLCKQKLGAFSRAQCLASPTDVMTTYSLMDIPETEAMLNNPDYSRIVSSSACLAGKPVVSSETFTCMYGFPATYLRREQTADLKLVADALFANGVNFHIYHGAPFNPKGSDTIDFFATTYFGPGGSLTPELPAFNTYVEKVSEVMTQGRTYSDVAVYIPYEDGVMKGAYPKEKQRKWVWGEYELRYISPPRELAGYHPLWINRHFLEAASWQDGKLKVGDAAFSLVYVDVEYMDIRALRRLTELAKQGLPVCLKRAPVQPGMQKSGEFRELLLELAGLPHVKSGFERLREQPPLLAGDSLPAYWCRVTDDGTHYLFLAQSRAKNLTYPVYGGQSLMRGSEFLKLELYVNGHTIKQDFEFKPYQSQLLKISPDGEMEKLDITFVPREPMSLPREVQKSYF